MFWRLFMSLHFDSIESAAFPNDNASLSKRKNGTPYELFVIRWRQFIIQFFIFQGLSTTS